MKKEEQNKSARIIIAVIFMIVMAFIWFSIFFPFWTWGSEEYKECVESCASDNEFCRFDYMVYNTKGEGFIPEDDYDECSYELTSCIDDCDI